MGTLSHLDDKTILIVDDCSVSLCHAEAILRRAGLTNIVAIQDGMRALELVGECGIDLIILDLLMPKLSGLEICRLIRETSPQYDGPILIVTGLQDHERRVQAFDHGASDLVVKPFNVVELVARVRVHLENHSNLRRLRRYRSNLQKELSIASDMQKALLPKKPYLDDLRERLRIEIDSVYEQSNQLGGDLWGIWQPSDGKVGLFICDFSGHGVSACINTFRFQSYLEDNLLSFDAPEVVLARINGFLTSRLERGQYATMWLGFVDLERNLLTFANAGSHAPLKMTVDGIEPLVAEGPILGVSDEIRFASADTSLRHGDSLFLFSDALIEGPMAHLGVEGALERKLVEIRGDPAAGSMVEQLANECRLASSGRLSDDLTLIELKRL